LYILELGLCVLFVLLRLARVPVGVPLETTGCDDVLCKKKKKIKKRRKKGSTMAP
jgi:hypothetical protein